LLSASFLDRYRGEVPLAENAFVWTGRVCDRALSATGGRDLEIAGLVDTIKLEHLPSQVRHLNAALKL
jgi:hypothetical protein